MRRFHSGRAAVCLAAVLSSGVATAQAPAPTRIAENIYAFLGSGGVVSAENRGNVANAGFIIGPTGVVVIDTGTSYRQGRRMLEAIREVTSGPVELVILTHAAQEFIFGAAAFAEAGATIAAHRETMDLMKARCARCLENLGPVLGAALAGTRLVLPTRTFEETTRIRAGGLDLELLHFGWASTPGDLAVFDPVTGTVFAGGMVAVDHVPQIRDSDFSGWQQALAQLEKLPIKHVVPGFGPVSDAHAIDVTAAYLSALDSRMRALYAASSSLLESLDQSDLTQYRNWSAYDVHHRQNAQHRYLQLEIEDLGGDPRSTALPQN